MLKDIPLYQGKPTAYLDHNILDFFTKHKSDKVMEILFGKYQVVYSDETLKEIQRSDGGEERFLDLLNELQAWHLKIHVDEYFKLTDQVILTSENSYEVYRKYKNNIEPVHEQVYQSMLLPLKKIYGGIKNTSSGNIVNAQIGANSDLHDFIVKNIKKVEKYCPELASLSLEINRNIKRLSEESSKNYLINQGFLDGEIGVDVFRSELKAGSKELNNIKAPNVLQKIYDLIHKNVSIENRTSIEKFFHMDKNPIEPTGDYFDFQKVNVIYSMLNMLGYYPDSKLKIDKRFIASQSDQGHAVMASFVDALFSEDKSFLKKVEAIYEFLGIRTKIHNVTINR
ncbi:hypothetical protein [Ignatzschineria sp. LJL83]